MKDVHNRYIFAVLAALGLLLMPAAVFALPPTDVAGKIVTVDDGDAANPLKVGSEAYGDKYDICDAQCMAERAKGNTMFTVAEPYRYEAPANSSVTFNSSDVQTVEKYFPADQNSYIPQGTNSNQANQANQTSNSNSSF